VVATDLDSWHFQILTAFRLSLMLALDGSRAIFLRRRSFTCLLTGALAAALACAMLLPAGHHSAIRLLTFPCSPLSTPFVFSLMWKSSDAKSVFVDFVRLQQASATSTEWLGIATYKSFILIGVRTPLNLSGSIWLLYWSQPILTQSSYQRALNSKLNITCDLKTGVNSIVLNSEEESLDEQYWLV
jgi:hypothetical protein